LGSETEVAWVWVWAGALNFLESLIYSLETSVGTVDAKKCCWLRSGSIYIFFINLEIFLYCAGSLEFYDDNLVGLLSFLTKDLA